MPLPNPDRVVYKTLLLEKLTLVGIVCCNAVIYYYETLQKRAVHDDVLTHHIDDLLGPV